MVLILIKTQQFVAIDPGTKKNEDFPLFSFDPDEKSPRNYCHRVLQEIFSLRENRESWNRYVEVFYAKITVLAEKPIGVIVLLIGKSDSIVFLSPVR